MTLIIEDGSIIANANSYVTLDEARTYATARGVTLPIADSDLEILLICAMDYLEAKRNDFQGAKSFPTTQELQWPRYGVKIDCVDFDSNSIPKELKNGQIAIAIEKHKGVELQPSKEQGFIVSDKTGPLTTTYSEKMVCTLLLCSFYGC